MKEIKKIDPASLAKVAALFGVIWGLLIGVLFLILRTAATEYTGRLFLGFETMFPIVAGVAAIVLLPILYGITGYVGGYILAYIYNLVVEKFGGVKIDLK